jgi:hypothetical protein
VLGENVRARKSKSGITFSKHATLKSKKVVDAKRFMNKFKAWHGDDYEEGLDDGSVFGSLEMSYNSPPSSPRPVRELPRHEKFPDTSYTVSLCSVASTVASLTRTVSAPAVTTPQYPVQRRTSQHPDNLSLSFMALKGSRSLSAAPTHPSSYLPSTTVHPLTRLGNESSKPAIVAINSRDTSQPKIIQDCLSFLSIRNSNQDTTSESDTMDYSTAYDLSYLVCGIDD